jgi:hypothetical protein
MVGENIDHTSHIALPSDKSLGKRTFDIVYDDFSFDP